MWQLGLALSAMCLGAAFLRDRCILGVSLTLLVNWIVNTGFVRFTGDTPAWGFFLGTDYASGVFVVAGVGLLCQKFTFGSVVIGLSYAAECVLHAAYGLSEQGPWAQYYYWWSTFYVAIGQMMFVIGWGVYELARRADRARRSLPLGSPIPSAEHISPAQEP